MCDRRPDAQNPSRSIDDDASDVNSRYMFHFSRAYIRRLISPRTYVEDDNLNEIANANSERERISRDGELIKNQNEASLATCQPIVLAEGLGRIKNIGAAIL